MAALILSSCITAGSICTSTPGINVNAADENTEETPDFSLQYTEGGDEKQYIRDEYELPYVGTSSNNNSGSFSNNVKWKYNLDESTNISSLTFTPASNASNIPEKAINSMASISSLAKTIRSSKNVDFSGITEIGKSAFDYKSCNYSNIAVTFQNINFGIQLETIEERAFADCTTINSLVFPESLTSIGKEAFNSVNTTVEFIGGKSITFGENAFSSLNSNITVTIPQNSIYKDNDGNTTIITPDSDGKFSAVFGDATVRLKEAYTLVPEFSSGCETSGYKEHYCDCNGNLYFLENGEYVQTDNDTVIIPPTGHHDEFYTVHWIEKYVALDDGTYNEYPKRLNAIKKTKCTGCGRIINNALTVNTKYIPQTEDGNERNIYWVKYTDDNGNSQFDVRQKTGHFYSKAVYKWSEDRSTVTATRKCNNDSNHNINLTVQTTQRTIREATNTQSKQIEYTADFNNKYLTTQTAVIDCGYTVPVITGANLTLDGIIQSNVYLSLPINSNPEDYYVVLSGPNNAENLTRYNFSDLPQVESYGYKIGYKFKARQMGENFSIAVYHTNGDRVQFYIKNSEGTLGEATDSYTYSVKKYLDSVKNNPSNYSYVLRTLVKAISNYGIYARTYFNKNDAYIGTIQTLSSVQSNDVSEYKIYYKSGFNKEETGFVGYSLLLHSDTTIRLYFSKPVDLDNTTIKIKNEPVPVVLSEKMVDDTKYYYIDLKNISARNLNGTFVVNLPGDYTFYITALSYVYDVLKNNNSTTDMNNLIKSLYRYHTCAVDYFNSLK